MTLDVSPRHSATNCIARGASDAEFVRKVAVSPSECSELTHFDDLTFGELHLAMLSALRASLTTFHQFVEVVIDSGAKEQMVGVDASLDIATVEHAETFGDRATMELVTETVSKVRRFVHRHLPITVGAQRSLPQPTSGRTIGLFKVLEEFCGKLEIVHNGHVNLLTRLAGLRVFQHRGGFVVPILPHAIKEA